ncbi:HugZ family pyridoxamine 5'-phosphate oxidase [Rhizobium sp.]
MADGVEGRSGTTPTSVIRPTDEASLKLARRLVREARFAAISVLDPETGHPLVSRVLTGTDIDGVPVILISTLAAHTKALLSDPRCALLFGEPGKGDPPAWPRVTVLCDAERLDPGGESDSCTRKRFLRRHPKSKLYADFPGFAFFRLVPKSASLNGGFGRAYIISGDAFIIEFAMNKELSIQELHIIETLEKAHCNAADRAARVYFQEKTANWYISGLDAEGIDIARKEKIHRLELVNRITSLNGLIVEYSNVLNWRPEN